MKRIQKMVHLSVVAGKMAESKFNNAEKRLGLDLRVCQVLGPNIAKQIQKITMQHGTLTLTVNDPEWRRQLAAWKPSLITHLSSAISEIKYLEIKG